MLTRRLFMLSSAAAAAGARAAAAQPASARTAQLWSELDLLDRDGRPFRLADIPQSLKLVKLWAHWCPACLAEMPSLASMASTVGEANLQVLLISNPDDWRRDQLTADRRKLPFRLATPAPSNPAASVRQALADQNGAFVVPRSLLFVGRDNALKSQMLGSSDWSDRAGQMQRQLG